MSASSAPVVNERDAIDALLVPMGDEWHSVRLDCVREVVIAGSVTEVPEPPIWLLGLVNLRGDVLPVIDSARPLGLGDVGRRTHHVVVDTMAGPAALAATGAPRSERLADGAGAGSVAGAAGRFVVDGSLTTLLDIDDLLGLR